MSAIQSELEGTIPARRRMALEGERERIAETLAAARPEHASIAQEVLGLTRAMETQGAQVRRLQAALDRSRADIDAGRRGLEVERGFTETRTASRRETAHSELRRAVARLAQEGYGLKLADGEAAALTDRLIRAPDADVPALLQQASEEFVTRPRGAADTLPGRSVDRGHWRETMRERVELFTRSLGHDLTRDETQMLTNRLVDASPAEVERMLAEFVQRPLTFGEDLDLPALPGGALPEVPMAERPAALLGSPLSADMRTALVRDGADAIEGLRRDPAVNDAVLHEVEHIRAENPDAVYRESVQQPDGSFVTVERRLADVLDELDALEMGGKNLEACLIEMGGAGAVAAAGAAI